MCRMCQCSCSCSSLTCWIWLLPASVSGMSASALPGIHSLPGSGGSGGGSQPCSLVVPISLHPFPGQAWRWSCMEHWSHQWGTTQPCLPQRAPHISRASRGKWVPTPCPGESRNREGRGSPQPCVFGSTWHLLPSSASVTQLQQHGECWCSVSSSCSWHKDGKGLWGLWWQRGHNRQKDPGNPNQGQARCDTDWAIQGKVLSGLDTPRGFGAGQQELLGWEVTVVAAPCPLSCLATCFPLGDGTLGWRAAGAGHTARR